MKKFFACIFILLIFSGAVFYIGWTQFKVHADCVGVVVSKTNGIDKNPVKNGEFSWYWQFLLPTNAKLKIFSIKPLNVTKNISGQLPSGSVYSAIANSNDDFSYSFDFSISVTVAPETIPLLLEENKITSSEDLTEYLNNAADSIAQITANYLLSQLEQKPSFRPESVRRDDLLKNIKIYKEFPEIDVSVLAVTSSKMPDYLLYKKFQEKILNQSSFNNQNESEIESVENNTFNDAEEL